MVNKTVYFFSRFQLVWLLCGRHWLSLAALPMVSLASLTFACMTLGLQLLIEETSFLTALQGALETPEL